MNAAWREHLERAGARIDPDGPARFGDDVRAEARAALGGDVLASLDHLAFIDVTGADALQLLQGQLTNDLRAVDDRHAQLSAWCNPKGRVLALFRVSAIDGGFRLRAWRSQARSLADRLRLFVLRADARVELVSDSVVAVGIAGPGAAACLDAQAGLPHERGNAWRGEAISVVRLGGDHPRYEVVGPVDALTDLWDAAAARAVPVGAAGWTLLGIRAGEPDLAPEQADQFLPQMLNLQVLDGLSFHKGCYVGQEVVARTRYLGRLKRRMYLARVADGDGPPSPGDPLYGPTAGASQSVGTVVNVGPDPDGGWLLLAVVKIDHAESGPTHLRHVLGAQLELLDLPYAVENEAA